MSPKVLAHGKDLGPILTFVKQEATQIGGEEVGCAAGLGVSIRLATAFMVPEREKSPPDVSAAIEAMDVAVRSAIDARFPQDVVDMLVQAKAQLSAAKTGPAVSKVVDSLQTWAKTVCNAAVEKAAIPDGAQPPFTVTGDRDLIDFLSARIAQSELWTAYFTYVLQESPSPIPLIAFDLRTTDREETWTRVIGDTPTPKGTIRESITFRGPRKYALLTVYPVVPHDVALAAGAWCLTDDSPLAISTLRPDRPSGHDAVRQTTPAGTKNVVLKIRDVKDLDLRYAVNMAAVAAIERLVPSPAFKAHFKPVIMRCLNTKPRDTDVSSLLPKLGEEAVPLLFTMYAATGSRAAIAAVGECGRSYPTCRGQVIPWLYGIAKRDVSGAPDNWSEKQYAIEGLGKCGTQALTPIVYILANEGHDYLTDIAWTALGRLANGNEKKVLSTLVTYMGKTATGGYNPRGKPVRATAQDVLPWFLDECTDPVALAFIGLTDSDPRMQQIGADILDVTVPDWGEFLRLHTEMPRREKELTQLLKTGHSTLRGFAARRLGQIASDSKALQELMAALKADPDPSVSFIARRALENLGKERSSGLSGYEKFRTDLEKAGAETAGFPGSSVILPFSCDILVKHVGIPTDENGGKEGGQRHYLYYRVTEGTARITLTRDVFGRLVVTGRGVQLLPKLSHLPTNVKGSRELFVRKSR